MNYIEVKKVSDEYLRNDSCDVCGKRRAVTKRCLVQFDCGYNGELNICTRDLTPVKNGATRIEGPTKDHFHVEDNKQRTWLNLDDVSGWIRASVSDPEFVTSNGGAIIHFKIEGRKWKVIRHGGGSGQDRFTDSGSDKASNSSAPHH